MAVVLSNREGERKEFEEVMYSDHIIDVVFGEDKISKEDYFARNSVGNYFNSKVFDGWKIWQKARKADRPIGLIELPKTLDYNSQQLVVRFAEALAQKLKDAETKYGYTNEWQTDTEWEAQCQENLIQHLYKGDPRDVAIYAAFCWHHKWNTYRSVEI
jgi:hypothetical protein